VKVGIECRLALRRGSLYGPRWQGASNRPRRFWSIVVRATVGLVYSGEAYCRRGLAVT
jgi:hypothetical protein